MSNRKQGEQDRIVELLEEILKWIKFEGMQNVKSALLDALQNDPQKIRAYHFSDGRGSKEVANLVGLKSHTTIIDWWAKWAPLGIVEPIKVRGGERYKRVFSLEALGIGIPELKAPSETEAVVRPIERGKPK